MAGNVYLRSITLGDAQWQPLADEPTVMTATIVASAKNSTPVSVRVDGGAAVSWPPGATARLEGVDLSRIEVLGSVGHIVLVAAHTR